MYLLLVGVVGNASGDMVFDAQVFQVLDLEGFRKDGIGTASLEVLNVFVHKVAGDAHNEGVLVLVVAMAIVAVGVEGSASRKDVPDFCGGRRTVHDGHFVVQQDEVVGRFPPVRGLPDHIHGFPAVLRLVAVVVSFRQQPCQQLSVRSGVVDDQNPQRVLPVRVLEFLVDLRVFGDRIGYAVQGKGDGKTGAAPPAGGMAHQRALVLFDDALGNEQAESRSVSGLQFVHVELNPGPEEFR
mmetsp:Transcript_1838/g.4072  ORF Transcript_1838/g.4072 Transcript_1838/m.4072 type:complete len:240 (+) Transcript_1838:770-1489(+)